MTTPPAYHSPEVPSTRHEHGTVYAWDELLPMLADAWSVDPNANLDAGTRMRFHDSLPMLPVLPYPFSHWMSQRLGAARRVKLRMSLRKESPHCFYCGTYIGKGSGTLEHVLPRSRGGLDSPDNLKLACSPCNSAKGRLSLLEWLPVIQRTAARVNQLVECGVAQ